MEFAVNFLTCCSTQTCAREHAASRPMAHAGQRGDGKIGVRIRRMSMRGSCLCNGVEYEIDSIEMPIWMCHCQTCRKANASAFVPTAGVNRDNFRWIKGQEKLTTYESSPGKLRHFCSICGSHVVAERTSQPNVVVRVATLEGDPGVVPTAHIWTSHDVPWLNYEEKPSFDEWPNGR